MMPSGWPGSDGGHTIAPRGAQWVHLMPGDARFQHFLGILSAEWTSRYGGMVNARFDFLDLHVGYEVWWSPRPSGPRLRSGIPAGDYQVYGHVNGRLTTKKFAVHSHMLYITAAVNGPCQCGRC
ncbi:hypothetical protein AUEXF2481DRAFT_44930 [Aureobasidium subglaciale EXF-2481]|uniref:Uncharacterized protein n=1 Tax=Aureobasidium subglaciale (strain EXF-2481) TaxID=1043005 RepID=A0A074XYR4_AURSE|nr:uncharacterized protein AUEXF2481DRAFT_44930 [Aureobasidium subglaciale EXF-2481]KEQ90600.1 hypothetical protein AUEXF2481DRAFT_44930 [Aureobasidium subglaciale EXF-2481]